MHGSTGGPRSSPYGLGIRRGASGRSGFGPERSAWLSPRDAAEPVRAAVEANCVTFTPANRISANRYLAADLEEMMQQLGYRAVDDAWASR